MRRTRDAAETDKVSFETWKLKRPIGPDARRPTVHLPFPNNCALSAVTLRRTIASSHHGNANVPQ